MVRDQPTDGPDRGLLWAQTLLDRYGLVDRTVVGNERVPGGFHGLFSVLRRMDDAGRCQQVYAVEVWAVPSSRRRRPWSNCAWNGPANLCCWPRPTPPIRSVSRCRGRLCRRQTDPQSRQRGPTGTTPLFYLDAAGRSLLAWEGADANAATQLFEGLAHRRRRVLIRRINGEEVFSAGFSQVLQDAGFRLTPSGLR